MCGMSEGLRLQCLQPTPESRAHCVAAEGGTKTFPLEELWVPVDKEGSVVSPGRVYVLVYSGDLPCSRGLHFPDNKCWLYK